VRRSPRAFGGLVASDGQALVEYAFMVPFLFLLIMNLVNFGGFIYDWVTVSNAARAGAQYAAMGAAYASYPIPATLAGIQTVVQNETAALPGASSSNPAVTVCQNNNGTTTNWGGGTCPAGTVPPQDPETITGGVGAVTYTSLAVDVDYTYTPFIPSGFTLFGLGIAPAPSTVIHRRAVMRVLN
jgi:Flp pilus assembly protein TadG